MTFDNLKHDQIIGSTDVNRTPLNSPGPKGSGANGAREPVYAMVGSVANGLTASEGRCITPGGAFPQVPGLPEDTQVYQFVAAISQGVGYGPGNALVPVPPASI